MERLAILLEELSHVEYRFFETENADAQWFKGKQMAKVDVMEKGARKGKVVMTTAQKDVWQQVKSYVTSRPNAPLDLPSTLPARDRKFVEDLADSLHLQWRTVENDDGERQLQLTYPEKMDVDGEEDDDEQD